MEANPVPPTSRGVTCANHENLPAMFVCRRCNIPICDLCAFPQDDGSRLCPSCATVHSSAPPPLHRGLSSVHLAVQGQKCKQHPNLAAVQICRFCGVPLCATCDFLLPGNVHACPACATAPPARMSPRRKTMLIASFVLAGWCTLVIAAASAGAFRGFVTDRASQMALGLLIMAVVLLPAIAGVALGVSSKGRQPATIPSWIAIVWNGLFLAGFLFLMLIGMLMKK